MRILWSVNTIMPQVASKIGVNSAHAISWVDAMSKLLAKDESVKLAIASDASIKDVKCFDVDGIVFYVLPKDNLEKAWNQVVNEFKPDVIHQYGTERRHNIPLIKNFGLKLPYIISLQGILKGYERAYYAGIDVSTILRNLTLKDLIRGSIIRDRRRFQKNAKFEAWQLNSVAHVEGRSTWDRVYALSINPNLQYHYCPRLIREPFYRIKWDIKKMEPHSIFVHQGNYPIKGLHFVFEALASLIPKYPDIKLYIAGQDELHKHTLKEKLLRSGYSKYLLSLYHKYHIENYVHFLGKMTAEEVALQLSKANVMVIPSAIENCPNSLAEAMLVGTPSVASYVGGNAELLNEGECGKLYCYNEPLMLADCIDQIFSTDDLAIHYSEMSIKVSSERHDPQRLKSTLLEIYKIVIENK